MAAYIVAQLDVHDPETFQRYREKVADLVKEFGGRYLVRGGDITPLEGELSAPRLVIIEFDDVETAKSWYFSDAYQKILPLRLNSAKGTAVIADGI